MKAPLAHCIPIMLTCLGNLRAATPNDPRFNAQWNLNKIAAPAAWEVTTGSTNIVVAIIDTGVDYTHPDLAANMWRNPGETGLDVNGHDKATNGIDDDSDGYVDDVYGIDALDHDSDPMDAGYIRSDSPTPYFHGTAIAGVIGAAGNNGTGIAGVNWSMKIMALRRGMFDQNRFQEAARNASIRECFHYVLLMKRRGVDIRVVNASFGAITYDEELNYLINSCGEEGILTVCAAGNLGIDTDAYSLWPASYDSPWVIDVAASTDADTLYGPSDFGRSTVDLAAPGDGGSIVTTSRGSGYTTDFGATSAAAPQVAGAAALLFAARPTALPLAVKAALMQGVDQRSALRGKVASNGRLNIARALEALTNHSLPPVVVGAFPHSSRTAPQQQGATGLDGDIELFFNQPMDPASVEAALEITPAVLGNFSWTDGNRIVRLQPSNGLIRTNYSVRLRASAQSADAVGLDGNFNQIAEGSPTDDYVWGFRFAPEGDTLFQGIQLSGKEGEIQGTTRNASPDAFELDANGLTFLPLSVWYDWVAPTHGWYTFDTLSATRFDSVLSIQVGTDDIPVFRQEVARSDNYGGLQRSRVSFRAETNGHYAISVAGKIAGDGSLRMGDFTLRWYPTPPPGFTGSEFSPARGAYGTRITLTGTNLTGATEVLFTGASGHLDRWAPIATNTNASFADLELTVTVPTEAMSGPILVRTPQGEGVSTAGFEVLPPAIAIHALVGGEVEITWPIPVVPGFGVPHLVLESAETLGASSWSPVLPEPDYWNGRWRFNPGAQSGPRFYRLRTN